jgi:hypothetical protein
VIDLSKKYFGDLIPENRMGIKPEPKEESEIIKKILEQYKK